MRDRCGERIGSDHNRITVRRAARQAVDGFHFTAGVPWWWSDGIGKTRPCRAHGDSFHCVRTPWPAAKMPPGSGWPGRLAHPVKARQWENLRSICSPKSIDRFPWAAASYISSNREPTLQNHWSPTFPATFSTRIESAIT